MEAKAVKLEKTAEIETEKLSTADMDVYVAKNFPSVVKYEMKKGDLNGKTFYGQTLGYQYGAYQRNRCETFQR